MRALTVAVAMCGLFVFGLPILTSFGIAGRGVVLLCMAAAVTLLPATLAAVGRKIPPTAPVSDVAGRFYRLTRLGARPRRRIITSAAFLIVIVFAGFAAGEVLAIKQLGVGLAIAVLVDATIVRTLLVPATMKLLGERNWWAPAPLRRFHHRFGLHEAPAATTPPADEPSIDLSPTTDDTEPEVHGEPVGAGSGTMLR